MGTGNNNKPEDFYDEEFFERSNRNDSFNPPRVDDELRYGNKKEQEFNDNRMHNIPNNNNMDNNPGGGTYGDDYYTDNKGPGRFDQFNDEFDGSNEMKPRDFFMSTSHNDDKESFPGRTDIRDEYKDEDPYKRSPGYDW